MSSNNTNVAMRKEVGFMILIFRERFTDRMNCVAT